VTREDRVETLRRFFAGLTEFAFQCRLGVVDPPMIDYITGMLVRFVRCDDIFAVRTPTGKRIDQVADMLLEAQQRQGEAKRHIHRHIGDFTLFWLGVYPEIADRMRRGRKDSLIDYHVHGKRAYHIASTIPVEKEVAPTEVLQRLSDQFDLCVYGLSEVRRQWERKDGPIGPAVLL